MMKKSHTSSQAPSLSAKTPAKVPTTPNLLPLKISPDDEHTKLEKSAMLFMPTLHSPKDDEEKQATLLAVANEHESLSLALPTMLQDPFSLDDHLSFSPCTAQSKKRSHRTFVLRPRRVDRLGMETPYQEVGADSLPRKRPRMPLFVSLDDDAHNDDHHKHRRSHAQESELEASTAASDSSSSWPYYNNSSITPRWSYQTDDMAKTCQSTSNQGSWYEYQEHFDDPPNLSKSGGMFQCPDYGETVIALPRVFRPTIRRMTSSSSKSHNTHGLSKVFAPSSTSAFSVSHYAQMVVTPSSRSTSPSSSR